ncbi:glycine betaine ABC transporter substrate-binding protein [Isoptericola sp. NPDC056605]|uniref:glycine betaine ABC transporter substrate-binding protein n=1 Tax=Isoptericola sp. NPDC056605 TaxID=3345876 RepID=UPI003699EFAD
MSTHRMSPRLRRGTALAAVATLGLTLAACSSDDGGSEGGDKEVTLGYVPGWPDGLTMANLLEHQLTAAGYDVELEELNDVGVLYTAVADGDVDMYPSAWSGLHESYMEKYEGKLENLGDFYDGGTTYLGVPEYTDVDSIEDLADNVDKFGGTITGIEASAGVMDDTEEVIEAYGLEDAGYTLKPSGTPAMLAALDDAIKSKEDILVTMWTPFWPNAVYPLKQLEDPKGAFDIENNLQFQATAGFGDEQSEVAEWLGKIKLDDEQYSSLEKAVAQDNADDPQAGVEAWLEENPDVVPAFEG